MSSAASPAKATVTLHSVHSSEAIILCQRMTRELNERYPEDPSYATGNFDADEAARIGSIFAIAYVDGEAVGCGAIRPFQIPTYVELKRVFVAPKARRQGISKLLISALDEEARKRGYKYMVLETGDRQPEAVALYLSLGFVPYERWGHYKQISWSLCFRKAL